MIQHKKHKIHNLQKGTRYAHLSSLTFKESIEVIHVDRIINDDYFFCKGGCRGSRRTGAQFDCALPYRELSLLHSSDVQLILFRYSLFDVLISQVENKEGIEKKWNDSYDMNKVKRWTTEHERLFSQKQSQQQDLK